MCTKAKGQSSSASINTAATDMLPASSDYDTRYDYVFSVECQMVPPISVSMLLNNVNVKMELNTGAA